MENKLTAVEWLIKELTPSIKLQQKYIDELETKAKEMEKQQLINFGYLQIQNIDSEIGDLIYKKVPEEIYNETFNK